MGKNPTLQKLKQRWHIAKHAYLRFTCRFTSAIRAISNVTGAAAFVASVVCIVGLIIYFGFEHTPAENRFLGRLLRVSQIVFLINIIYNLVFNFRQTINRTRIIKWVVDIGVLATLLPLVYPHPENPWIPFLEKLLYSNAFLFPVLAAYSAVDVSYGVVKMLGKRTNPSLILSVSFLLFIIVGAFLLMMPKCTVQGISFVDSLFLATSAVCITGLTTVDVSQTFTPTGLIVLAVLIQTGGLGVMTFTSFFALFFSGDTSIYSQLMVKDMIYSKTINALLPTLLYILGFTLVIEAFGAVAIFLCVHGTLGMTTEQEAVFSAFHSLSAFCNAGFSNIEGGLSNPLLLHSDQSVYLVASSLILAGGIGFPILVNFKTAIGHRCSRLWQRLTRTGGRKKQAHIYDLNTKIVLVTTAFVTIASTLLFLLFEYDNALAGMTLRDKIIQSVFNSFVPRSSGFSSVNPAGFLNITLIMFVVLMWIGGASQSTAGGIKVNTLAAMILNLKAVVLGRDRVTAFRRTISVPSLRRAHAVIGLSVLAYIFYAMLIMWLEPDLGTRALLYEAASALFTVGSSLGITPMLGTSSKILLCTAMFLGRVGIISLLIGIVGTHTDPPARYPSDNIIIN